MVQLQSLYQFSESAAVPAAVPIIHSATFSDVGESFTCKTDLPHNLGPYPAVIPTTWPDDVVKGGDQSIGWAQEAQERVGRSLVRSVIRETGSNELAGSKKRGEPTVQPCTVLHYTPPHPSIVSVRTLGRQGHMGRRLSPQRNALSP